MKFIINKITEFKNSKGESFLFVRVPEDAVNLRIMQNSKQSDLWYNLNDKSHFEELPTRNWRIIGIADEISEKQAETIVDSDANFAFDRYKNYNGKAWLISALSSFKSLMKSIGLVGKYVVIREEK